MYDIKNLKYFYYFKKIVNCIFKFNYNTFSKQVLTCHLNPILLRSIKRRRINLPLRCISIKTSPFSNLLPPFWLRWISIINLLFCSGFFNLSVYSSFLDKFHLYTWRYLMGVIWVCKFSTPVVGFWREFFIWGPFGERERIKKGKKINFICLFVMVIRRKFTFFPFFPKMGKHVETIRLLMMNFPVLFGWLGNKDSTVPLNVCLQIMHENRWAQKQWTHVLTKW